MEQLRFSQMKKDMPAVMDAVEKLSRSLARECHRRNALWLDTEREEMQVTAHQFVRLA